MEVIPELKDQCLILAVSGGIDSIVMLDMMSKYYRHLVVAHFEHGIRGEASKADAKFVKKLAQKYQLPFEIMSGSLGPTASEEAARKLRYEFLRQVARTHHGVICTAHHADDVLESVAINLQRGTGWRGLAVMNAPDIYRPLIGLTKAQIRKYAKDNQLTWQEDTTNQSDYYLRNRIRTKINQRLRIGGKEMLFELYQNQLVLAQAIDRELTTYLRPSGRYQRYFYIMIDPAVAEEILRFIVKTELGQSLTRPQAARALLAIKISKPRSYFQAALGVELEFTTRTFKLVKTDLKTV